MCVHCYDARLKNRGGLSDRAFASFLEWMSKTYGPLMSERKASLFQRMPEDAKEVTELGYGTGPNFKFYKQGVHITAVEPNPAMAPYAAAALAKAGVPPEAVTLVHGVAEALPVPDASQDAVVSTLVLCSVLDVAQALSEVVRVLKPGGVFIFFEHVADAPGTWRRSIQDAATPLWSRVMDGCHLNRDTAALLQGAGFTSLDLERFDDPSVFAPVGNYLLTFISGVAVK